MSTVRRCLAISCLLGGVACSDEITAPDRLIPLPEGTSAPGVQIVAGGTATDTINAPLAQPVIVRVRDAAGRPVAGARLVAAVHGRPAGAPDVYLTPNFDSGLGELRTDARGYAQYGVWLGGLAGEAIVEVYAIDPRVPAVTDTARFMILAGRPATLKTTPLDTALYVGATVRPQVTVADRQGNALHTATDATLEAATPHVHVQEGAIVGASTGRSWVRVRAGGLLDSIAISVVPRGRIAAANVGFRGRSEGVFVFELDGSSVVAIPGTPWGGGDMTPEWHPGGTSVLLDFGPEGWRLHRWTLDGVAQRISQPNGLVKEWRGQYTADGAWIFFTAEDVVYRMRADGTEISRLAVTQEGFGSNDGYYPSPSPDGRFVVAQTTNISNCAECDAFGFALRHYDVAGGTSRLLGVRGTHPRWSPTGDAIAFIDGRGAISTIKPDGTGRRTLTRTGQRYEHAIDWSPDGRWIIARAQGWTQLHLIEVATSSVLPLAFTVGLSYPAWQP